MRFIGLVPMLLLLTAAKSPDQFAVEALVAEIRAGNEQAILPLTSDTTNREIPDFKFFKTCKPVEIEQLRAGLFGIQWKCPKRKPGQDAMMVYLTDGRVTKVTSATVNRVDVQSSQSALIGSEKDLIKAFVQAVKRGDDLNVAYPGLVLPSQKGEFARIPTCTPSNLVKRSAQTYTVDWDCPKIADSGFIELYLSDGKIASAEFVPISVQVTEGPN